jgi:ATP-binding cassette subfamily F protein 3
MPPKKGGKKGGGKSKTSTVIETAKTREDVDYVAEEKVIPRYLIDGFTQKDRDIVIDGYYMYTPNGKNELLRSATVRLVYGRHYGLIGQNGIGKSTLLNAISNYQIPGFPQHLRVVHVHQEEIPKVEQERTVLDYVLGSDEQKNYLEAEEERLLQLLEEGGIEGADTDNMDDFDEIQLQLDSVYQRLDEIGARTAEARVRAILTGLQFTQSMQDSPIKRLSGGWRMRVRLACALFVTPDILLLDEPTNHLDFPAVEWLASFLRQYEPTLLVVSHDRGFLDQVMTDCIDFRDKTLMYYRGDYTNYLKVRSDFIRTHNKLCDKIEKKRQALVKFIAEARQKAKDDPNLADMAKTRQRVLDGLPVMEPIREDRAISFAFPDPGTLDHAIIQCNDMSFHYDSTANGKDKPYMLNKINANVDMTSRIGVMGANGAGKTTLINVLLGKYEALEGKVTLNDQARAKIFTQHHLELLDENVSPLQFMMERFPQVC